MSTDHTQPPDAEGEGEPTLTPVEQIAQWAGFALLVVLTTVVTLGSAGYLYARWITP